MPGSNLGDAIYGIPLALDEGLDGFDFGELMPGVISGFAYVDENRDGLRTVSSSAAGVLMPLLDFFWKACSA